MISQLMFVDLEQMDATPRILQQIIDELRSRADDLPSFTVDHTVTPCTHNPLGVKGCGEAGAIGAPAAVMNAITDALGIKDVPMPATAQTIWRSMQKAA